MYHSVQNLQVNFLGQLGLQLKNITGPYQKFPVCILVYVNQYGPIKIDHVASAADEIVSFHFL